MVLEPMPDEATTLTSLPSYPSPSATRRISTISDASGHRVLNSKRSQRRLQVRPSHPALQRLDNDAAQLDMKNAPAVQAKKSSSSIFSLFSKPKVEKARGYGGEASSSPALPNTIPPKPVRQPPQPQTLPPQRPPSQIVPAPQPIPSRQAQRASIQRPKDEPRIKADKNASWVPPPLFQAFARSVKHGLCETSVSSADKSAARLKAAAKERELEELADRRNSLDSELSELTRRTKMTVQTSKGLSSTHVDVPQKIVVLLDDGHILQYSQLGPTNRLPEKVLQLGAESAAFVSDATPTSPGALRIVQNTGSRGFSLQSTVNAFSRLTRRSMNPKKDVPNLLFAFRTSQEINEWLQAIRGHIDAINRPTSSPASEREQVDSVVDDLALQVPKLDTTPESQSTSNAPSPIAESAPQLRTPPKPPQTAVFEDDSDESQRKGSLELVEEEAEKLLVSPQQRLSLIAASKRMSDAPSFTSSSTPSMDAQALSNLRNSARMSHNSAVTNVTSRTSSMTSEPSSSKASPESSFDGSSVKSPYRSLSSYQASKRRSLLQSVTSAPQPTIELTAPEPGPVAQSAESPLLAALHTSPPITRSSSMRSPPVSSAVLSEQAILDSTPTITEEDERPESIVADLPPPSTWTSKLSPKKRSSLGGPPVQPYRYSSAPLTHTPQQAAAAANRRASHGFRIPLKVNPNVPVDKAQQKKRNSTTPETVAEPPKVFTLEAKVDPKTHRMSVGQNSYPSAELRHRASQRLSLFPSPLLSQSPIPEQLQRRVSSATRAPPESVPTRQASLQRPTSLQVRTDRAPFLSSVRSPTAAPSEQQSPETMSREKRLSMSPTAVPIRAAPIRQLKPSRSASAISSMTPVREYGRAASPTDPFTSAGAQQDSGLHIPQRRQSYMNRASYTPSSGPPSTSLPMAPNVPIGNSFAQQKMNRTSLRPRQSILAPLAGLESLGPPAPPPNAPLPAPPDGAPPGILSLGTGSTTRSAVRLSTQAVPGNGLGIRV